MKALIMYQSRTMSGRQRIVLRDVYGRKVFEARHAIAAARFLKRNNLEFYEYDCLPRNIKQVVDKNRKQHKSKHERLAPVPARPTLGDYILKAALTS